MLYSPDIIVTGYETPEILLVAEVKLLNGRRTEAESRLKMYMLQMRCPTGLLVTPDVIDVYRDRYIGHSASSVERVGTFAAPKDWDSFKSASHGLGRNAVHDPMRFEETVKSWLVLLANSPSEYLKELPKDVRDLLKNYVIPALTLGDVRLSGPRESLRLH